MKDRSEARSAIREDRIHNGAIVRASPEEQAMGWYTICKTKLVSVPGEVSGCECSPRRSGTPFPPHRTRSGSKTDHCHYHRLAVDLAVPLITGWRNGKNGTCSRYRRSSLA